MYSAKRVAPLGLDRVFGHRSLEMPPLWGWEKPKLRLS